MYLDRKRNEFFFFFSYICFEKARKKIEDVKECKKTDRYELVYMDLSFFEVFRGGVDYIFEALVFFSITNFSGVSFSENVAKTPVFFFIASAWKNMKIMRIVIVYYLLSIKYSFERDFPKKYDE